MLLSVQTGGIVSEQMEPEQGYRLIKECGFDGVDWNLDHAWNYAEIYKRIWRDCVLEQPFSNVKEAYAEEIEIIRKNGLIVCQAHAPFPSYVADFPELDQHVGLIYENCIRLCQEVGCKYLVVHGISRRPDMTDMMREEMLEMNLALYERMIPVLKETEVVVCLENLFRSKNGRIYPGVCSDPYECIYLIDTLNEKAGKKCFGLCFDTGHLNLLDGDMEGYLKLLGKRVCALHIHDNYGKLDDHKMPYNGTICWESFCRALREIGYEGTLNFETFHQYTPDRMEADMVPCFLRALAEIGKKFRDRIQGAV